MNTIRAAGVVAILLATQSPAIGYEVTCPDPTGREMGKLVVVDGRTFEQTGRAVRESGPTSSYCLSCHDGTIATTTAAPRTSVAGPQHRGLGEHPVDILYPTGDSDFRPISSLDPRLRLEGGKVTCLTCHTTSDGSTLSMPNDRSRMCTSCHAK